MSGSDEPGEVPLVPIDVDPPRPVYGESFAERAAMWRRDPRLITAGLVLIALAAGAWWVRLSVSGPTGVGGAKSGASASTSTTGQGSVPEPTPVTTTTATSVFIVDVVGAVRRAGVVSLPSSARVVDALTAAGGSLPNADLDRINLAAHLVDGMRIAVPRGFPADAANPTGNSSSAGGAAGAAGEEPAPGAPQIDLNSATRADLETLPGIGPSLAQAIIQERDREGGFHSVDDLRRVRGIGDVRFAQLRPLVTV